MTIHFVGSLESSGAQKIEFGHRCKAAYLRIQTGWPMQPGRAKHVRFAPAG
jgi:hypothetical protein